MPNWCENRLTVVGHSVERLRFLDAASSSSQAFSLNGLIPEPSGLRNDELWRWRFVNWGVKWDVQLLATDETGISFLSPWGPPIPFLKRASERFRDLYFVLNFFEPGMAFCGTARATQGQCFVHELEWKTDDEWDDARPLPTGSSETISLEEMLSAPETYREHSEELQEIIAQTLFKETV